MKIIVKCFATLATYTPQDGVLETAPSTRVEQVIKELGIAPEDVKIIFINGHHVPPDTPLSDSDRLGLFPAVGGG